MLVAQELGPELILRQVRKLVDAWQVQIQRLKPGTKLFSTFSHWQESLTHFVAGSAPVVILDLLQVLGEDLLPVDELGPGGVHLPMLLHKLGEEDVEGVLVRGDGHHQGKGQARNEDSQHLAKRDNFSDLQRFGKVDYN